MQSTPVRVIASEQVADLAAVLAPYGYRRGEALDLLSTACRHRGHWTRVPLATGAVLRLGFAMTEATRHAWTLDVTPGPGR